MVRTRTAEELLRRPIEVLRVYFEEHRTGSVTVNFAQGTPATIEQRSVEKTAFPGHDSPVHKGSGSTSNPVGHRVRPKPRVEE